jgi:hypothetical protein
MYIYGTSHCSIEANIRGGKIVYVVLKYLFRSLLQKGVGVDGGGIMRRKIILIKSNTKCRYLKKLTRRGTLRQVFYLSEAPSPPMNPPPPPYTLYTCLQYNYSHREGEEGGGELKREKVRGAIVHKAG